MCDVFRVLLFLTMPHVLHFESVRFRWEAFGSSVRRETAGAASAGQEISELPKSSRVGDRAIDDWSCLTVGVPGVRGDGRWLSVQRKEKPCCFGIEVRKVSVRYIRIRGVLCAPRGCLVRRRVRVVQT